MNEIISLRLDRASSFNREHFKTGLIGTSDCNNFVPIYSLNCHDLLLFENREDIKILEYAFPNTAESHYYCRQYSELYSVLTTGTRPTRYIFTIQGEGYQVNALQGLLYDDAGNILLCLAINSNYILSTPKEELSGTPDPRQFVLILSTKFDEDKYKNIKKKLSLMYIQPCIDSGIDIVTTTRANEWVFKNNFKQPKFRSVMSLMKHLKEEVPKSLLID